MMRAPLNRAGVWRLVSRFVPVAGLASLALFDRAKPVGAWTPDESARQAVEVVAFHVASRQLAAEIELGSIAINHSGSCAESEPWHPGMLWRLRRSFSAGERSEVRSSALASQRLAFAISQARTPDDYRRIDGYAHVSLGLPSRLGSTGFLVPVSVWERRGPRFLRSFSVQREATFEVRPNSHGRLMVMGQRDVHAVRRP